MHKIGVTGHLHMCEDTATLVRLAVRDALRRYIGPDLRGVTCLAEGADQIFAQEIIEAGGSFEVVLPAADYRRTVVRPANRPLFDRLLAAAAKVDCMPFAHSGAKEYRAAGEELLRRSAVLFAVWDGVQAGPIGGTADMVALARQAGIPVQIIWPVRPTVDGKVSGCDCTRIREVFTADPGITHR